MPAISIYMPVYNCAQTVEKAIASVCQQTFQDWELLVVDDCSNDGTAELVGKFASKDQRIKMIPLPKNLGHGGASAAGIQHATGEWVAVVDADDWIEPRRFEILLREASAMGADLIFDNLQIYDHKLGRVLEKTMHGEADMTSAVSPLDLFRKDNSLLRNPIGYVKPMVKRAFLLQHQLKYPAYRVGGDFVFLASIILSGAKTFIVPDAYYVYVHRTSPTTRATSSFSRSGTQYVQMLAGCDEIMEKYGQAMSPAVQQEAIKRRRLLEHWIDTQEFKYLLHQKRQNDAARLLLSKPMIAVFIVNALRRVLIAKCKAYLTHNREQGA